MIQTGSTIDFRAELERLGDEARAHRFAVAPNPCVGAAVLASDGRVLGRGFHRRWGRQHAEIDAIRAARDLGATDIDFDTLVVTLEPCSSRGKTPPCTRAILECGVRRVVVGELDPDPRHRGRGIELLREAGVEVEVIEGVTRLETVAPHFLRWNEYSRLRRPRPWLIAKWAQTRTGQLSPPEDVGEGRWISSSASQLEVQDLRRAVDAILTGVGTVKADDPRLSLRSGGVDGPASERAPMRLVLDSELATPPDARLFAEAAAGESAGPVYILCRAGASAARHRALADAGARIHGLRPNGEGRVDLREALEWMWRFGARRVLLEAGPTLLHAFFEAGFVDQLRVYTGAVNGGRGESAADLLLQTRLDQRLDREVGDDAVLEAFPVDGR
ncbi:MAG: bifunctional diaminohydroxyphosphoribosylaminopyrimidine deaminase/5-amino-6-(5-phosphoribosylamino)uracil reductase RibD [Planctomycetota bacterium]